MNSEGSFGAEMTRRSFPSPPSTARLSLSRRASRNLSVYKTKSNKKHRNTQNTRSSSKKKSENIKICSTRARHNSFENPFHPLSKHPSERRKKPFPTSRPQTTSSPSAENQLLSPCQSSLRPSSKKEFEKQN